MKIAHVVTYISEDGAFGGPVAVARAQTAELAKRGHEVTLLAGWDGRAEFRVPGVRVGLFPVKRVGPGFSGLIAPGLDRYIAESVDGFDVFHVHAGRDLITLSAARRAERARKKLVLQTHGMLMPDRRIKARLIDTAIVRRVLQSAQRIFALTDREETGLGEVVGRPLPSVARIANGVETQPRHPEARDGDRPVVVFLARLHPRKRVMAFAEAARLLLDRGVSARFLVFGPDEGDLAELKAFIRDHELTGRLDYLGALAPGSSLAELEKATVYVLPAYGEVFPMTVLEAMSVGTSVVLAIDCAIADELNDRGAATITTGEPADVADSIAALLDDRGRRERQVAAADDALSNWLSIGAVADQLESVYA